MVSSNSGPIARERLSSATRASSSRCDTLRVILDSSETIIGRTFRLCGAIGVMMKLLVPGKTIGPPQLNE